MVVGSKSSRLRALLITVRDHLVSRTGSFLSKSTWGKEKLVWGQERQVLQGAGWGGQVAKGERGGGRGEAGGREQEGGSRSHEVGEEKLRSQVENSNMFEKEEKEELKKKVVKIFKDKEHVEPKVKGGHELENKLPQQRS